MTNTEQNHETGPVWPTPPTPEEVERMIDRGRRLRSQALWSALRALFSKPDAEAQPGRAAGEKTQTRPAAASLASHGRPARRSAA